MELRRPLQQPPDARVVQALLEGRPVRLALHQQPVQEGGDGQAGKPGRLSGKGLPCCLFLGCEMGRLNICSFFGLLGFLVSFQDVVG